MIENLTFAKELLTIIGSVTAILCALAGLVLWIIKKAFQRGELYQLFKSLVNKVSSIEEMIEDKFIDNDTKHKKHSEQFHKHDNRITKLEVISNVKENSAIN